MRIRFLLLTALASLSAMESFAQAPKVTTDPRFVRGTTMAFGRIKSATTNGGATISKLMKSGGWMCLQTTVISIG